MELSKLTVGKMALMDSPAFKASVERLRMYRDRSKGLLEIWKCHRILYGTTMLGSFILSCVILGICRHHLGQLSSFLETRDGHWSTPDDSLLEDSEPTAGRGLARVHFNDTPSLKRPAIETVLDRSDKASGFAWPTEVLAWVQGLAVIMMILSLFGLYTAWDSRAICVIVMTIALVLQVLAQFTIAYLLLAGGPSVLHAMKNELQSTLKAQYEFGSGPISSFSIALNSVMVAWECCGVSGPADFLGTNTFIWAYEDANNSDLLGLASTSSGTHSQEVILPLACCKRHVHLQGFNATLECAAAADMTKINSRGCFSTILDHLYLFHGAKVLHDFYYVVGFETAQIILLTILANVPRDFERTAARTALQYAELTEAQAKVAIESAEIERLEMLAALVERRRRRRNMSRRRRSRRMTRQSQAKQPSLFSKVSSKLGSSLASSTASSRDRNQLVVSAGGPASELVRQMVFVPHARLSSSTTVANENHQIQRRHTEIW